MLQKINRIHRSGEYRTLKMRGKSFRTPYFKLIYAQNSEDVVKVGIVVSNHVGGAVERNRIKRRIRAIIRHLLPYLQNGMRIVIICRPEIVRLPFISLKKEIIRAMQNAHLSKPA